MIKFSIKVWRSLGTNDGVEVYSRAIELKTVAVWIKNWENFGVTYMIRCPSKGS